MQDWDRLVMIGVGAVISIHTGLQARRPWQRRNWLAVVGLGLLILAAIGVPLALAVFT